MKKSLLNLEHEIEIGQENAEKAEKLYQLLSSYNAYNILLLKAKSEYEGKEANVKRYYSNSDCYEKQIADLFSSFKTDECIKGKEISGINNRDMLFLIDQDTLLIMKSSDIMSSNNGGLSNIKYNILKINSCIAKVYNKSVYCRNPYYYDTYWEDKEAFGLFYNKSLVTPSYELESQFKAYDNLDIREILKPQSFEEIYEKITDAKNRKTEKLVLSKCSKL